MGSRTTGPGISRLEVEGAGLEDPDSRALPTRRTKGKKRQDAGSGVPGLGGRGGHSPGFNSWGWEAWTAVCPWGQCWDHGYYRSGRRMVGFESQGNVRGTTGPRRRADLLVPTVVSRLHSTSCPLFSRNHLRGLQVGGSFSEALWPVFVPQCSPLSELPMSQGPSSPGLCAEDRLSLDCPCPQHHVCGRCSGDRGGVFHWRRGIP